MALKKNNMRLQQRLLKKKTSPVGIVSNRLWHVEDSEIMQPNRAQDPIKCQALQKIRGPSCYRVPCPKNIPLAVQHQRLVAETPTRKPTFLRKPWMPF